MTFSTLFETEQTGNRIDLLSHSGREWITEQTTRWWESQGWQAVVWDNTGNVPAKGRNRIIRDWKASDRDCLVMADDDITLYTHRYSTQTWLDSPITEGVYTLNSNHKMHYLRQNSTGWQGWQWLETQEQSQFYVIANRDIPLQDEQFSALEDLDWAWQCWDLGIRTHLLQTVFLREQSQDKASLIAQDRETRRAVYAEARKLLEAKWGTAKWSEFKKIAKIA